MIYKWFYSSTFDPMFKKKPLPQGKWLAAESKFKITAEASDGLVPITSQTLKGKAAGMAVADHVDIVGHFDDSDGGCLVHGDVVIKSGANFNANAFEKFWRSLASCLFAP